MTAADSLRHAGLDVVRAAPAVELGRADDDGAMPSLFGHFSRFGEWYEINSWFEGNFLERVDRTAFDETMAAHWDPSNPHRTKVQFQHGMSYTVGDYILGKLSRFEADAVGGFYEAPLFDTQYNRELLPGLEAGEYGASFRFRVLEESINEEPGVSEHNPRGIPEVTLMRVSVSEVGPVAFGASPAATAGVRSLTDEFYELVREHDAGRYADACRAAGRPVPEVQEQRRERVTVRQADVTIGEGRQELRALSDEVLARLDPSALGEVCTRRRGQELVECRTVTPDWSVSHDDAAGTVTVRGTLVTYDVPLDVADATRAGWVEVWADRSCKRSLDSRPDVRLSVNGQGEPVARSRAETLPLLLRSTDLGLEMEATWRTGGRGDAVVDAVERGDAVGLEVQFDVRRQRWDETHARRDVEDVTLHDLVFRVSSPAPLDVEAVAGVRAQAVAAVAPAPDGEHMSLALAAALRARFED